MLEDDKILTRREGRVGYLIFNNPDRHNAVSLEMWKAAAGELDAFAADGSIGVVVLTGAGGKAFVAGADISRFEDERASQASFEHYNRAVETAYSAVHDFPKPTIAMVRGYCMGGGLGLAIACDIRIASETAVFAMPATRLGIGYDLPGIMRFIEVLGPSFTKEMFFTARRFDAEEARFMGLANRVVPDAEIEDYVRDCAGGIAANAPLAVNTAKFIVGEAVKDESKRNIARCSELVQRCFASRDYIEGRRAFMEKRRPAFTGS